MDRMKKQKIIKVVLVLLVVAAIGGYFYWKDTKKKAEIARQEEERRIEEQKKLEEKQRNEIKPNNETAKITTIPENFYLGYVMSGNKIDEIAFSKNGGGVAYKVVKDGKAFIVLNEKEGKHYDDVGRPMFSPDSQKLSFPAKFKDKWAMVFQDKESKSDVYMGLPTYSSDGKIFSYFVRTTKNWFVVSNDQPGKLYTFSGKYDEPHVGNHLVSDIIFSPDGQKTALIVSYAETIKDEKGRLVVEKLPDGRTANKLKKEYFVSVNGQDGEKYEKVSALAFSPDSQKLTYGALKNGKWYLVTNSEEQGPYNYSDIYYMAYGSDNSTLMKVVDIGGRNVILTQDKTINADNYIPGSLVALAPDNKTVAYTAKNQQGKYYTVYGGHTGKEFDYIDSNSLRFNADGTKIMYGGLNGNEFWWMVEDVK
jgi:WD40 repeat protein